ncbi:MAG: HAD-IG family 5'-nucleotidase [Bradymonadales bacterium]|jgi:5'-nucleotidase
MTENSKDLTYSHSVFANRTLNLRSIRSVGYDMDYTLVHYHIQEWEEVAFEFLKTKLLDLAWPVADCEFDGNFGARGLVLDLELGNIVKANRFGYITKALHGFRQLNFDEQRETYTGVFVDINEARWYFMNTFFSLSEICMFAHVVDALDAKRMPAGTSYATAFSTIRRSLDEAHAEGFLKAEIAKNPERFVDLDPDIAQALMDQSQSGKKVVLITNSDWIFTRDIMRYAFDRYMPKGKTWIDLFDLVVVSARKPSFFTDTDPIFKIINDDGDLRPVSAIEEGHKLYLGGNAILVEEALEHSGAEILYVGDHVYSDVNVSKAVRRWRTCLILRELEEELHAMEAFSASQERLDYLMQKKDELDARIAQVRLEIQREKLQNHHKSTGPLYGLLNAMRGESEDLEAELAPLASQASLLTHELWGPILRAGNDKSLMARQMEQHSDVYSSRVSNFLHCTPFAYLRSQRGMLPHETILMKKL